ncbi:MAG: septum site-determining protein MinC [Veillonellaceae bacterium]|nr:septum site-determining protein MinC [Veillonellaceae bacterium]
MRSNVVFKGSKNGLQLIIDDSADFESVIEQLRLKLESASAFFASGNALVHVPAAKHRLTSEQQKELITLFNNYGLTWQEDIDNASPAVDSSPENQAEEAEADQTLIFNRTVRNGQEVVHRGTVIVMGDVNPGAKVIAGGDIIIHGTCRGIAHAGALGNISATITADRLIASQIRIAHLISRAPDNLDIPECIETARIKDGVVIIEPAQ